ncbi:ribosomal protein S18 acetylase RimI-like enzyme [Lactobacillus colini]|uniref:Ribosomal protein S18 acetylase RimI-like enzyme n=1 Tax=Lactobacillus colini TaxID=1819254 RepID=A0ABS4MF05_9LACO|nr:GNAT family N-acetyltransferase [Lactobacillus colini]MBP2057947.1 ribosomal protein S18 acetylase RimI-like enzyme [Lactobacillus colini]
MEIIYRPVQAKDLKEIVELEADAFHMSREMVQNDMVGRITNYPDTFWVAEDKETNRVVGHIFGPAFAKKYIEDEIYFKNHPNRVEDDYQMILSLAVLPEYRLNGIASHLLAKLEAVASSQERKALSLTCRDELINFYEKFGYQNEGTAQNLPGETLYNMVKQIKKKK